MKKHLLIILFAGGLFVFPVLPVMASHTLPHTLEELGAKIRLIQGQIFDLLKSGATVSTPVSGEIVSCPTESQETSVINTKISQKNLEENSLGASLTTQEIKKLELDLKKAKGEDAKKLLKEIAGQKKTLQEYIRLRKKLLAETMRSDPDAAFRMIFTDSERELIKGITANCAEEKVVVEGTLEVVHTDFFATKTSKTESFLVTDKNKRFALYAAKGVKYPTVTGTKLKVRGFLLDDNLLFDGNAALGGSGTLSGNTGFTVLNAAPNWPPVLGDARTLAVSVSFNDSTTNVYSKPTMQNIIFSDAKKFYSELSYGKVNLTGTAIGPYKLNRNKICDIFTLADDVVSAVDSDIDFTQYDQLAIFLPQDGKCGSSGQAIVGKRSFITNDGTVSLAALWGEGSNMFRHEMGHNFGNGHSNFLNCGAVSIGDSVQCTQDEYGDPYSVMSLNDTGHFNAYEKKYMGWFDSSQIMQITQSGAYTIEPIETATGGIKAALLPNGIYVEYRQPIGYDSTLKSPNALPSSDIFNGALLHIGAGKSSLLIDSSPPGSAYGSVVVHAGEIFSYSGTSIKVLSATASGLTVQVSIGGSFDDTTPPSVSFRVPQEFGTVSGDEAVMEVFASDNVEIERVEFFVDDIALGVDTAPPYGVVWDSRIVLDGTHDLVAKAFDKAGNSATARIKVTIDNTRPQPPSGILPVVGEIPILVAAVDDPSVDNVTEEASIRSLMEETNQFYKEGSYNQMFFKVDVVFVSGFSSPDTSHDRLLAEIPGVDVNKYRVVVFETNWPKLGLVTGEGGGSLPGSPGTAVFFGTGLENDYVRNHEIGHAFNLNHARGPLGEYGDFYDMMGKTLNVIPGHFNAVHKQALGWLDSSRVLEVKESGRYTINAFETPASEPKILKIKRGVSGAYAFYVEYRQKYGFDAVFDEDNITQDVYSGALFHESLTGFLYSYLIDGDSTDGALKNVLRLNKSFWNKITNTTIKVVSAAKLSATHPGNLVMDVTFGPADVTPPQIHSFSVVPKTVGQSEITIVTSDDLSGVRAISFFQSPSDKLAYGSGYPYIQSKVTLPNGQLGSAIYAKVIDWWGNMTVSEVVPVGSTPNGNPSVSLIAPANNSSVSGAVAVSASASDNIGIAKVEFFMDTTTPIGTDTTAPYSVSWNSAGVSNGSHTLSAKATDTAGNTALSSVVTVTVNNVSVSKELTIATKALGNIMLGKDASTLSLSQSFKPTGTSLANVSVALSRFGSPSLPITLAIRDSLTGANLTSATITPSALSTDFKNPTWVTANFSGAFSVNPASVYYLTLSMASSDASNYYRWSVDTANPYSNGNIFKGTVAVAGWDGLAKLQFNAPPVVGAGFDQIITLPVNSVSLAGTATDDGLPNPPGALSLLWSVVGGSGTVTFSDASASDTTASFASSGEYLLRLTANDGVFSASDEVKITVQPPLDAVPPSVDMTAPANNSSVSGAVAVSASASDNIGIAKVEFFRDATTLIGTDTTAPYSVSWNSAGVSNGSHTLSAKATDAAGNTALSSVVTVTVNNVSAPAELIIATKALGNVTFNSLQNAVFSQSFKPTKTSLANVSVALSRSGSPSYPITFAIRDSLTGANLTSATITPSALSTDFKNPTWVTANFPTSLSVNPGTLYYLTLSVAAPDANNYYRWSVDTANPYPDGNIFKGATATLGWDGLAKIGFGAAGAFAPEASGNLAMILTGMQSVLDGIAEAIRNLRR